jgi:hypothetical protein
MYHYFINLRRKFGFRNGRWRSKWSLTFNKDQTECELTGVVKSQVIK